ncbi:hypothetical protein LGK97_16090 [Clostridium sp. CS001]|uniref:hypothetical protein n=1 Tax=Clostridium sp. CS001 TaxID=2880648 RepID=UPI001CF1AB2E|nr:hypothetical protein [Clostridium sp. CS001]MCB2291249.1 hypothetical protein [Clostridium sp. CS001]
MKKRVYVISFIMIFLLILGFQYKVDYDIRSQAPSDKWSKEVVIAKADVYTSPKILKSDKNNIIAFNDGDKLKVVIADDLGKKVKEKSFETKAGLIKEVNLLKGQGFFYLSFSFYENGANILKTIKLDKELNEVEQTKTENVTETYQVGEEILIVGHKDKVEVLDMSKNSKLNLNIKGATLFSGVKIEKGFMITYCNGEEGFSYITVENGVASTPKIAGVLNKSGAMTFMRTSTSSDAENGYVLVEYSVQGEFVGTRVLRFALDGSSKEASELYINENKIVYNILGTYSKEGARFFATTERVFGKKDWQKSIVEFILKGDKVASYNFASRLARLTIYPAVAEDTIVYCSYNKENEYGIYMGSQNEQFKKVNNVHLPIEKEQAVLNTLQGFMYSLVYIVYPIKWVMPIVLIIAIQTFFSYSFTEEKKKLYFIITCIVSTALKVSVVLSNSYGDKLYLLPQVLVYKWVGILISIVISGICYSFGYKRYKEDLEGMPISSFFIALTLDAMLTMMIYVPFFITL